MIDRKLKYKVFDNSKEFEEWQDVNECIIHNMSPVVVKETKQDMTNMPTWGIFVTYTETGK